MVSTRNQILATLLAILMAVPVATSLAADPGVDPQAPGPAHHDATPSAPPQKPILMAHLEPPVQLAQDPAHIATALLTHLNVLPNQWGLRLEAERTSPSGSHHTYHFEHAGLRLFEHVARLHATKASAWGFQETAGDLLRRTPVEPLGPGMLDAEQEAIATERALAAILNKATDDVRSLDAEIGWLHHDNAFRAVWRIDIAGVRDLSQLTLALAPGDWPEPVFDQRVWVDATSHDVLRIDDRLVHAVDHESLVFRTNPPVEAKFEWLPNTPAGIDSPHLNDLREPVTLHELDEEALTAGALVGPHANVLTNKFTDGNFTRTRFDEAFEDTMVYHHIDQAQRIIQSLGFPDSNNEPQDVINTYLPGLPNAFYSSSQDLITMLNRAGSGNADSGEDGEVIIHEYGHAIHYDVTPDWRANHDQGSMGEGFSDFVAAAVLSRVSEGFNDECAAEWLAQSVMVVATERADRPCIRILDNEYRYTESRFAGVHTAGQIWSGLLWRIWEAYGADTALKMVLESHYYITPDHHMPEAAGMLIVADQALFGGAHSTMVANETVRRELDNDWADAVLAGDPLPTIPLRGDLRYPGPVDPVATTYSFYIEEAIEPQPIPNGTWDASMKADEDAFSIDVPMFRFYDDNVTRLYVGSNGLVALELNDAHVCCAAGTIPSDDAANGIIAPAWADLDSTGCGDVMARVVDEIIEIAYRDVEFYPGACDDLLGPTEGTVDAWVRIDSTTDTIEVHLLRVDRDDRFVTSGIESPVADVGNESRRATSAVAEPLAWRYTRVHVDVPPADPDALPVPNFTSMQSSYGVAGATASTGWVENIHHVHKALVGGVSAEFSLEGFPGCIGCPVDHVAITVPDLPVGTYDVRLENAEGKGTTLVDALTLLAPTDVEITGLSLRAASEEIEGIIVPTGAWTVDVEITNSGPVAYERIDGLLYLPMVLAIEPQEGEPLEPLMGKRTFNKPYLGTLGPGESVVVSYRWNAHIGYAGDYVLRATLDPGPTDDDPSNNERAMEAYVLVTGHGAI